MSLKSLKKKRRIQVVALAAVALVISTALVMAGLN